jgi:dTMP kinase
LLVEALSRSGIKAHLTREPSDGPIGRLLRQILAGEHDSNPTTLSLLFAADRSDHLAREVEPALAAGKVVVSDRWYHSSLAYQGTGEDRAWIQTINGRARAPDLTVLIEVTVEEAARRRQHAGRSQEIFDALEMQKRVAAGYRAVVELLRDERIEVVDGERPVAEVAAEIERLVLASLT